MTRAKKETAKEEAEKLSTRLDTCDLATLRRRQLILDKIKDRNV